jgi:hypothetical protein
MSTNPTSQKPKRPADEQRESKELVERIRKLRWMGADDEARPLQSRLRGKDVGEPVVADPTDTD